MSEATQQGRDLIERVEAAYPEVVELATLASLAARAESELLRSLRLTLAPKLSAAVEADLWFSLLVRSRGPEGIVLVPKVAAVLRERLRGRPDDLNRAWRITERLHARISPALALEERVTWLALKADPDWEGAVERELGSVLRALISDRRTGLARWALRALPSLPEGARGTRSAWALGLAANKAAGRRPDLGARPPEGLLEMDLSEILGDLPEVEVGVRRDGAVLILGEVAGDGTYAVPVPATDPRLIEVRWDGDEQDSGHPRFRIHRRGRELVAVASGETATMEVGSGAVSLRTPRGAVYELAAAPLKQRVDSRSFVPGFQEDIYLSYAHLDDAEEWVTDLHTFLDRRIHQLLGERVRLWRDRKLHGAEALWETLSLIISESAVFVSVLSPSYLKSTACMREAQLFFDAAHNTGGLLIGNSSRFFRVVKTPYERKLEPEFLRESEVLELRFYEQDPQDATRFTEFSSRRGRPGALMFSRNAEDLAQSLAETLQKLRMQLTGYKRHRARRTVFLADTTSDREADRRFIIDEMSDRCEFVQIRPLPRTASDLADNLSRLLARCELSVHLFGSRFGIIPEGEEERSLGQIQFEMASTTRRLAWIPEDLAKIEPRQQRFLNMIGGSASTRIEVVRSGRQVFINHLQDALDDWSERSQLEPLARRRRAGELGRGSTDIDAGLSVKGEMRAAMAGRGFFDIYGDQVDFQDLPDLTKKLAGLARPVPRRTEGRRSEDRELWCLSGYLLALGESGRLQFPLSVQKAEAPDFLVTQWNGDRVALEVTEAGTAKWQKAATELERRPPGTMVEGEDKIVLPGGELTGKGWPGDDAEIEWSALVLDHIRRKTESLNKRHFRSADDYHLLVYDNSHLVVVTADFELAGQYLKRALDSWVGERAYSRRFSVISILRDRNLLHDIRSEPVLLPVKRA